LEHFYSISRSLFQDEELKLLNPFFKSTFDTPFENILQVSQDIQNFDTYSQYSIAELMNYTKNVLLEEADQMSMANGLELRVPLLDIDLVELCLSIPDKFKHPHGYKKLLIDSLGFQLPEEIIHRKKMGFAFPWDQWMRKELHDFCKVSIKNLSKRSLFVEKEVIHIWEKFIQKDPQIPWMKVWLLVVLENWLSDNHIN
jgi:asparagine synthase (glutamine-hydrolysing)